MKIMSILFVLAVFTRTFSYGIFEIKNEKNKKGGVAIIAISIFSLIVPVVYIWLA